MKRIEEAMFKRVVIGVDEHDGGRDAIELARRLVGANATLTLVCVYANTATTWRGSSPIYEPIMLQRAQDLLANLHRETAVDAMLCPIGATSAGRGLHAAAEQAKADLLVVGSSRRGLLGRVLLSADTREALNGIPCPAAIAPAGYSRDAGAITRIGVGYNGSAESVHALAFARQLATGMNAHLSALDAVEIPINTFATARVSPSVDFIDEMVDSAFKRVSALPGVEPHASYGRPAEELAYYSESVDLLVVGSRGYGPAGRLVHGSTSSSLTGISHCPLLLLTRAAGDRFAGADVADRGSGQPQPASIGDTVTDDLLTLK